VRRGGPKDFRVCRTILSANEKVANHRSRILAYALFLQAWNYHQMINERDTKQASEVQ
jgi:hypothetical protein